MLHGVNTWVIGLVNVVVVVVSVGEMRVVGIDIKYPERTRTICLYLLSRLTSCNKHNKSILLIVILDTFTFTQTVVALSSHSNTHACI
eukprot:m.90352 g.90352  ORF g.90352 m.90352 type:complete len:88 (-) comp12915_c0_seq3:864-1127(-)